MKGEEAMVEPVENTKSSLAFLCRQNERRKTYAAVLAICPKRPGPWLACVGGACC